MENNSFMKTLFKIILGGIVIYFLYNLFVKKKMKFDDIPLLDQLQGLEDKFENFTRRFR
jgi:hypothetical protein